MLCVVIGINTFQAAVKKLYFLYCQVILYRDNYETFIKKKEKKKSYYIFIK